DAAIYYYLDEFVKLHSKDLASVFAATIRHCDARLARSRVRLLQNIELLARVLDLTEVERSVLLHASLCKYQRDLRPVLVDCKASSAQEAYALLASVLRLDSGEVAAALRAGGRLESLGLIDTPIAEHAVTDLGDLMRVSDRLLAVLTAEFDSESDMMAAFTRPAGATSLTIDDFSHVRDDARYLVALLAAAADRGERGVNVLLYGPPGTGKTEFAKLVAQLAGCELYEVDCLDRDGNSLTGKERYRSLQVSQAFLRGRARAALLFDEVEDVFPPVNEQLLGLSTLDERRGAAVNGKAWVNQTLEQNPVPTLWVSNSISQIDPAYRRRYQFHLELANPPQRVRENIARKHLQGLGVDESFVLKIAARGHLTPAQIQSAARFAALTRGAIDEPIESLIERQLDRAARALGQMPAGEGRDSPTRFDLSLLNVETRFPIDRIIASLVLRPRATLCFYGLPGTGKTALAEHIAERLQRPLMVRRASDLISKYVGETEQQMARMFEQAEREEAVLLLDEADSFLQNRQLAVRNYEVTEVNEMLQGMERFAGVFVCTTNLFDRIDEAALRRFSFKLRFLPLTSDQRLRMFVAEVLGGDAAALEPPVAAQLARLDLLTPGDFAAVKRQFAVLGESATPSEFVDQLEREHRAKPDVRFSRPLGFVR
ncbi:MAG TPA: ATP-binding protein, partial [Burkholderiaceae bacterium]|nr:ATP-binding protein [Burkholderiaceae bacterium]